MNLLFIVVIIMLGVFFIFGYQKGFIRIVFSVATTLITVLAGTWVSPYFFDYIKENTTIYQEMAEKCAEKLLEISEKKDAGDIQEFPQVLGNTVYYFVEEIQWEAQMGETMAEWILRGMVFFFSVLLLMFFLKLLLVFFNIAAELPVMKGVNRLLGGLLGVSQGLLIIWMGMFVITLFYTSDWARMALTCINDSKFLLFLYRSNGILHFFQFMTQW